MDGKMYAELLLGVLGNKLLKEISTSDDSEDALIKAVLYLIYLSQDNPSPVKRLFIQGLLTSFPVLQDALTDYSHLLVEELKVDVVLDKDGSRLVTIHQKYIEQLSNEIENEPSTLKSIPRSFIESLSEV